MKMSKILSLVLAIVMIVSCSAALTSCDWFKKETITIWVSEVDGSVELAQKQVNRFLAANPDYDYEVKIRGVSEGNAASQVLADVASAPDIYCFAQDQLARLVQAKALTKLGVKATETVKANNDANSVSAASVAGDVYAYPLTSDNGYYLYYNTAVVTDPTSLEAIIASCEGANLKFRYALENAWYTASFFFATGCHSDWTTDDKGEFVSIDDDFNSAAGLVAMQGMHKLVSSPCYDSNSDIFTEAGAIVTGIWNANNAEEHFGENFGVTKLPSFTVDGTSYQLGSYSGNKLMGVKPQTDETKAVFCNSLAQYLSGEECQMERYEAFQWGPSNKAAQANEAVQSNPSLKALAEQNAHAVPQGNIGGSWWDLAKVLGAEAKKETVEDYQKALDDYDAAIQQWLDLPPEVRRAWFVIGAVNGTMWDVDFDMTEDPAGTWTSAPLTFEAGAEFKVRQGHAWTNNYGANGVKGGANIKVETAGTYIVKLVLDGNNATITLEKAE